MVRRTFISAVVAGILLSGAADALEGGTGAYLLGSRDTFAGIVPPPGTYVTNSMIYMHGTGPTLSLGGVPVTQPEFDIYLNKLDIAHFFEGKILGGSPGIVVTVPYAAGTLSGSFLVDAPFGGFKDDNSGFGDLVFTPLIGWHNGNFHYSTSLSIFAPTGKYNGASVSLADPSVDDVLNIGKNKWAFLPALNGTYFNPKTGFEASFSAGITFNTSNSATDWLTAPEFNLEVALLQHFANGLAIGVTGYAYQQLAEDSGSGAEGFKQLTDARSLKARVFALGPIVTYAAKFGETPVNFKLKYSQEFGARRRFESNILWGSFGFSF